MSQASALDYFMKENPSDVNNFHYICNVIINNEQPCKKRIYGKKKSNLTSHIQTVHKDFFNEHISKNRFDSKEIAKLRLKYIQHRAEIVAVNLRPYNALNDSGFRKVSESDYKRLAEGGLASGLNDKKHRIYKDYIAYVASEIRKAIISQAKNKLVSFMADISKKHHRSLLGIQIQFVHDDSSTMRSLGMVELREKHTAQNLKRIILERLALFDIGENQIATVTVDNGANVLAMITLMNEEYCGDSDAEGTERDENNPESSVQVNVDSVSNMHLFSDDEIQLMVMEAEAEAAIECDDELQMAQNMNDIYLDDQAEFENLLEELGNQFAARTKFINGIRCAEHTLQLGINDMLKTSDVAVLMNLAKAAAIKLRLSSYQNKLIENGIKFKIPHMFCITRWGSEYVMLMDLLLHNREAVEYFANENDRLFVVLLQKWTVLCDLMIVLKIPFEMTCYLQTPKLTLSDMYGRWLKLSEVELKRLIRTDSGSQRKFAEILCKTLEQRRPMVLNSPLVFSSVYMDPRYRHLLSDNQLKIAKETLYKWHGKIQALKDNPEKTKDSFDEFIRTANQISENLNTSCTQPLEFALLLEQYEKEHSRINYKEDVNKYWDNHRNKAVLFELAKFIHSIPPTQVEIEKSFSVVGFILSPYRTSLSTSALDDIIVIKLNENLFAQVNSKILSNCFEKNAPKF